MILMRTFAAISPIARNYNCGTASVNFLDNDDLLSIYKSETLNVLFGVWRSPHYFSCGQELRIEVLFPHNTHIYRRNACKLPFVKLLLIGADILKHAPDAPDSISERTSDVLFGTEDSSCESIVFDS